MYCEATSSEVVSTCQARGTDEFKPSFKSKVKEVDDDTPLRDMVDDVVRVGGECASLGVIEKTLNVFETIGGSKNVHEALLATIRKHGVTTDVGFNMMVAQLKKTRRPPAAGILLRRLSAANKIMIRLPIPP